MLQFSGGLASARGILLFGQRAAAQRQTRGSHKDSRLHGTASFTCKYFSQCVCTVQRLAMLFLCLSNWARRHVTPWGGGGIAPRILNLSTRWRWVVSFTPQPLYHRGKSLRYRLERRLGRFQSRSKCREDKNILPLPGIDPRISVLRLLVPSPNSHFANPNLTQFDSDKIINPLEHDIHLNTVPI
jgi:hypothetical protein